MKKGFVVGAAAAAAIMLCSTAATAGNVRGHYRDSDGDGYKETYVRPHQRTNPDGNKSNNYGSPGNYNPNTGTFTK